MARKAATYVAGSAGIGAAGFLGGWGVLKGEAAIARRVVGQPFDGAPDDNGVYGAAPGDPPPPAASASRPRAARTRAATTRRPSSCAPARRDPSR